LREGGGEEVKEVEGGREREGGEKGKRGGGRVMMRGFHMVWWDRGNGV
jgi:hypothetical protein